MLARRSQVSRTLVVIIKAVLCVIPYQGGEEVRRQDVTVREGDESKKQNKITVSISRASKGREGA
jgi:hypothetical protein